MSHGPIAVAFTMLDEVARAIDELGFKRAPGELRWPDLEPERKALKNLIQQYAELILGGSLSREDVFELAALFVLDGMVAQYSHDCRSGAAK
jgi:hypothetical protein